LEFNQNAKWASNNLDRIKSILRAQATRETTRDDELIEMISAGYTTTMISEVLARDLKWVRDQIRRLGLANVEAENVTAVNKHLERKQKAKHVIENVLVLKERDLPASEAATLFSQGGVLTSAPPSF
jgi:hypothetical protein